MKAVEKFRQEIMERMENIYGKEYEIFPEDLKKNNGVKHYGISLRKRESHTAPVIYLESFYEEYQNGVSIEDVIREIGDMVRGAVSAEEIGKLAENLKNFNLTQENLRCRLINYRANEEALKDQVFRRVSDLALVVEIVVNRDNSGCLTIRVRKELAREWGIEEEDLIDRALENGSRKNPVRFLCLESLLTGIAKETQEEPGTLAEQIQKAIEKISVVGLDLYVLTVKEGTLGAAAVMYPGCLETIAQGLGSDLLILPSSVHEVLIAPYAEWGELDSFREMVRSVNRECVDAEDWLSDQVYVFRRKCLMLEAA